jgi:hypothetical protein
MIALSQAAPDEGMLSHRGRVRALNEDSYGSFRSVFDRLDTAGRDELLRRKGWLYVVADGMGGHDHGDVASATAVQQICAAYYSAPDDDPVGARQRPRRRGARRGSRWPAPWHAWARGCWCCSG